MLPYGIVRYHGAPADLRDIPLGTVLHVRAFLPPDPKISAVPVLPVNNREKNAGYSGAGTAPAENHVLLLEDEPSHCRREGMVWKLKEVDVKNNAGMIVASSRTEGRRRRQGQRGNDDLRRRHPHLARPRVPCDRGSDRRGHLAGRRKEVARWPGRPARHHLEAHAGRRVHPLPYLGHLAGRRRDASVPPTSRPRRTRPSSAAAGCPPGSMPSSTASSAARP